MADPSDYRSALKLGQRAFRHAASRGDYPYLPVLDDFVASEQMAQRAHLGLMHIPTEHIVGTRAVGRTTAFASNFMPLMSENSEFAIKWERLCEAHLDEGIRDPVKVYEYLNRYYVEEGNKRVSVLKYFGAPSVYANVIRVLPKDLDDHPIYKEYLEFYAHSRVNYLEFSRPGGYLRIQELLGKKPGTRWTEEDRQDFEGAFYSFRAAFEAEGGADVDATIGDAMLAYLEIFGYATLRTETIAQIRISLEKIWEEIVLVEEEQPIEVKVAPEEGDAKRLSVPFLKPTPKVLKVAFVHDETPELSGWTYGHELGREYVQQVFQDAIETRAYFDALDGNPLTVIEEAIDDGCTMIFTTSPRLLPASLTAAVEHPKATILNCSINQQHRYIRTYYPRMYEAKFIAGIIAGALAGTSDVGYICNYPIPGQVAGINGFALGVACANPFAKVHLEWSSLKDCEGVPEAEERLIREGIWILSSQDQKCLADRDGAAFGLTLLTEGGAVNLAQPMWYWGAYYETLIRQNRDRSLQTEYDTTSRAVNYFWGMSAGVVGMRYSDEVPDATMKLAKMLERGICAGLLKPFRGPLKAQGGREIISVDQALSAGQIINMDWLNENVVGAIPTWNELSDIAKATVGIAGVLAG